MARHPLRAWTAKRLRWGILGFFILLTVPTTVLIAYTYSQLKWEAFHRERLLAEELVKRIDRKFAEIIAEENARPFTDYSFLNVSGSDKTQQVQRSPLSQLKQDPNIQGTIGYFQIDPDGRMSTPLLPHDETGGNSTQPWLDNIAQRNAKRDQLLKILSDNQLITPKPALAPEVTAEDAASGLTLPSAADALANEPSQAEEKEDLAPLERFEQLKSKAEAPEARSKASKGKLADLNLSKRFRPEPLEESFSSAPSLAKKPASKILRREQNRLPEQSYDLAQSNINEFRDDLKVTMFESEIDSFDFSVLDSGQFVLYRKVWKDGQRLIQGILLDSNDFLNQIIRPMFMDAAISNSSDLTIGFEGNIVSVLTGKTTSNYLYASAADVQGVLLLDSRLADPFSGIRLIFSVNQLPAGPGARIVNWLSVTLAVILCLGFYLLYRLGLRQIHIAQQQQDFISAVSHELKTPLTSIRMYGDMLMQDWVEDNKRQQYYRFIHDESERLSRLINNILQMARLTRNDLHIALKYYTVAQVNDTMLSKISSQVESAGFKLSLDCPNEVSDLSLQLDLDYFIQILINLVDNAIKFSRDADSKEIEISCKVQDAKNIQWRIRDFGPGIAKSQMRRIFELFYRSENELTRQTVGTGIGLALVTELTQAMQGKIDVVNRKPGAEFQITFPVVEQHD